MHVYVCVCVCVCVCMDNSLLWDFPVHCRVFSSIVIFPQFWPPKMSLGIC